MANSQHSRLGDSWVADQEADQDTISWDEQSAPTSDSDLDHETPLRPGRRRRPPSTTTPDRSRPLKRPTPVPEVPKFIMPSMSTSSSATVRDLKHRKGPAAPRAAGSTHHKGAAPQTKSQQAPAQNVLSNVAAMAPGLLGHVARWVVDVLGQTLQTMKKPIALVLALYLLAGLFMLVQNLLTHSIYMALSPVCRIPGVALLHLPICEYTPSAGDVPALPSGSSAPVEFDSLMNTQSHFEEILASSAAGVSLPLDMKRSETSIRDLRQIVRYSSLASRNELVLEFDGFIETARIASYDLQKFNAHVGRGVDIVLSTARWTQRVLDDMAAKRSARGLIPGFVQDTLLAAFKPVPFTEARLLDQYLVHTRVVSDEIERLIDEAQALLLVLQNLEDRLDVIHSVAQRDNVAAQANKDEILGHLWTLVGGNRAELGKYNNQLALLRHVGEYRRVAWAHVSATILKLQAMGAELEELRTRVSSAEVLKGHREIPLSVHVENLRLGVERLEQGRERAKRLEQNHVRRVLDGADGDTVKALPEE